MIPKTLKRLLNALSLALYGIGHAAVATFITNTRVIGVRDSPYKEPMIVVSVAVPTLAGLVSALRSPGGLGGFLASLFRPGSRRWAWSAAFTFIGARYVVQELYRHRHPRPLPREVLGSKAEGADMREVVAAHEGIDTRTIQGLLFRLNEYYNLEVATHELELARLPPEFEGFTLVQVSDVHYGHFISAEFVRRYVEMVIDMSPDLVALTGDYQQYPEEVWHAAGLLAPLGEWSRRERGGMGAVAILGNHDTWAGTDHVTHALRQTGIEVLDNKHVELRRGGASLYVAGVADPWSLRADLPRALDGVPQESCTILLAHEPDFLVESAKRGVDLQLSGHIHGGQIKLPFVGPLLSPSRFNRRYTGGFYKRENTLMYVSRGLGGHPPIRWACKPEITMFRLKVARRLKVGG